MFTKPYVILCVDYFNFLFCRGYVYVGASIGARSTLAQQMAQARAAALVLAALPSLITRNALSHKSGTSFKVCNTFPVG